MSREYTQYVVTRQNGNSGPYVVREDGYLVKKWARDHWETIQDTCQCGNLAITAGHFTNKREAERVAYNLNTRVDLVARRIVNKFRREVGAWPQYQSYNVFVIGNRVVSIDPVTYPMGAGYPANPDKYDAFFLDVPAGWLETPEEFLYHYEDSLKFQLDMR